MIRYMLMLSLLLTSLSTVLAAEGTLLVANRNGGSVSMIDLQTRTEVARLPIGLHIPHELAASPDGRWAVTGEYGNGANPGQHLVVIDVPAASIVSRIDLGPDSRPHSIGFLQDSRHVIVTMENAGLLALVDILDQEVVRTYPTGGQESHMVRLSKDDSRAYVASRGDGTMSVVWLDQERAPTVISTGARAEGIAVSPDGQQVWIANQGNSTVSIIDTDSLNIVKTLEGITTNRIEFLPDGTVVIPDSAEGVRNLTFYNSDTFAVERRVELRGSPGTGTGVRMLAAADVLILADSELDEISVFDPGAGSAPEVINLNPNNVDGMAWSVFRVSSIGE